MHLFATMYIPWRQILVYAVFFVLQFDIVCEDKFFRAHFLMTHYIGLLVGSVVCGFMSDTYVLHIYECFKKCLQ